MLDMLASTRLQPWYRLLFTARLLPRVLGTPDVVNSLIRDARGQPLNVPMSFSTNAAVVAIKLNFLLSNGGIVFLLAYLAFSFLGVTVSPLFFCAHLADIVYRNRILRVRWVFTGSLACIVCLFVLLHA